VVVDIEDLLNRTRHRASGANNKDVDKIESAPAADEYELVIINTINSIYRENIFILCRIRHQMCSSSFNCGPSTSRQSCQTIIERYEDQNRQGLEPLEHPSDTDEHQTLKHTVLLIILLCSMFVGLAVSIWTLVMEGMSGIYLELSFLDAFLNFGQGLIVLAVFITDIGELLMPVVKLWRKLW